MTENNSASFENTWFLNGGDFPEEFINGVVDTLCPPLFVDDFNLSHFARLVLGSASLSLIDKNITFENLPNLSRFQLDELVRVFNDEIEAFDSLDEYSTIANLTTAGIFSAFCLAAIRDAGYNDTEQELIVIRAMTAKKLANNPDTRKLLLPIADKPLIKFFYPNLHPEKPISTKKRKRTKTSKSDESVNLFLDI